MGIRKSAAPGRADRRRKRGPEKRGPEVACMIALFLSPLYLALNAYLFYRIIRWFAAWFPALHRRRTWVAPVAVYALFALSPLIAFLLPNGGARRVMKLVGNYWLGVLLYLALAVLLADLGRFILVKLLRRKRLRRVRIHRLVGGVLILVLLYRLRRWPLLEFGAAIVLCGLAEYFTSYYLELTHSGMRWWDYSGYFLNLNGRICAEGLFAFGVGGMAIVYFLAPAIDNRLRRLKPAVSAPLCAALLAVFIGDQIYSHYHPNMGRGITDYERTGAAAEILEEHKIPGIDAEISVDNSARPC